MFLRKQTDANANSIKTDVYKAPASSFSVCSLRMQKRKMFLIYQNSIKDESRWLNASKRRSRKPRFSEQLIDSCFEYLSKAVYRMRNNVLTTCCFTSELIPEVKRSILHMIQYEQKATQITSNYNSGNNVSEHKINSSFCTLYFIAAVLAESHAYNMSSATAPAVGQDALQLYNRIME